MIRQFVIDQPRVAASFVQTEEVSMFRTLPRSLVVVLLATAMAACSGEPEAPAGAPGAQSSDGATGDISGVIEARQANFEQMKDANDAIKREAEADNPDPAVFRENAAILIGVAANIAGGFPDGSGPQEGVDTDALPEIWLNKAEFEARASTLQEVLQQFSETAAGDDMAATIEGVALVGNACRECHQQFRKRD